MLGTFFESKTCVGHKKKGEKGTGDGINFHPRQQANEPHGVCPIKHRPPKTAHTIWLALGRRPTRISSSLRQTLHRDDQTREGGEAAAKVTRTKMEVPTINKKNRQGGEETHGGKKERERKKSKSATQATAPCWGSETRRPHWRSETGADASRTDCGRPRFPPDPPRPPGACGRAAAVAR